MVNERQDPPPVQQPAENRCHPETYNDDAVIAAAGSTRRQCTVWIEEAAKAGYRVDPQHLTPVQTVAIGAALWLRGQTIPKKRILPLFHTLLAAHPTGGDWMIVARARSINIEHAPFEASLRFGDHRTPIAFDPQDFLERLDLE